MTPHRRDISEFFVMILSTQNCKQTFVFQNGMDIEENTEETAMITLGTKLIQLGRTRDKSDNTLKAGKEHVIRR